MRFILTIDRLEGDNAVLKSEQDQTVIWPKNLLPDNAHEGAVLNFDVIDDREAEELKKKNAKDILNEIMNAE